MTMFPRLFIALLSSVFVAGAMAGNPDYKSPEQVAGAETVDVVEVERLHREGIVFVDVRAPRLHKRQHIPGSVHLDLNSRFTENELARVVARDQPFVVYCSGVTCTRSFRAVVRAVKWGFTQVKYFRGGVVAWRDAGLELQKAAR